MTFLAPGERIGRLSDLLWRDLRLALRRLRATPAFAAFAAVSIALSLGVTTAVYSTVSALVWNTSPIADAHHLAILRQTTGGSTSWRWTISPADFDALRSRVQSASAVAASSALSGVLDDGARTSGVLAQAVTGNFFAVVQLPIGLGRGIQESDDRPDSDPVIVLSHEFWQSKTGGDPGLIGRTVRLSGHPFIVVGVIAQRFRNGRDLNGQVGLAHGDAFIPLAAKPVVIPGPPTHDDASLTVLARLPKGTSTQTFAAEVTSIGAALDRSAPLGVGAASGRPPARSWSVSTAAAIAREESVAFVTAGRLVVMLVALVLIVACTNIANLTLGRGARREYEFGVRRALGATRGRLILGQCVESVVLALIGGVGALLIAQILIYFVTTDVPLSNAAVLAVHPSLDSSVLLAAGGALLGSLVVFGLLPAVQLAGASVHERIASDAVGASPNRWRGRRSLIAGQVTISTAFMLIAFASTRAVAVNARQDPGFDLPHLAVASVDLRPMNWDTARARQAIASIDAAARSHPAFTSVALTMGLPLGEGSRVRQLARVAPDADDFDVAGRAVLVRAMLSTPAIFPTLGVPILRGRGFDHHDAETSSLVMVVSEDVARQMFGTGDVVGRQLSYLGPMNDTPRSAEVIGVARETNSRVFDVKMGSVYLPLVQHVANRVLILGRVAGDPAPRVRTFAEVVRTVEPDLAVEFAATGPMLMTPALVVLRFASLLSGGLSILAMCLSMLGLYGVLSHVVERRTREIGVRLALGADPDRVRRLVVGEGLRPVLWGLGVGVVVGIGARGVLRATDVAKDISVIDFPAFAVVSTTLVLAGFTASYRPARRASKTEPNVALRHL